MSVRRTSVLQKRPPLTTCSSCPGRRAAPFVSRALMRESRSLTLGKGSSGTGTPRNLQSGAQPSCEKAQPRDSSLPLPQIGWVHFRLCNLRHAASQPEPQSKPGINMVCQDQCNGIQGGRNDFWLGFPPLPLLTRVLRTWLWVNNRYPKWNPGKTWTKSCGPLVV